MRKIKNREEGSTIDTVFSPLKRFFRFLGWKFYDFRVWLHGKLPHSGKKKSVTTKRRNEAIFYYSVIAFPLLQFLVFYVGVNFNSILLSFRDYSVTTAGGYSWVGFDNYIQFFKDFFYGNTLKEIALNSIEMYAFTLLVGFPLAILFSFYLYKNFPLSGIFKVLLFLPSIISSVVMVLMYKYFVDRGLPALWEQLFDTAMDPPLSMPSSRFGWIIFYNLFICYGTNVIMYTSSMTRIPPSLVEYARLEGAGYFRELISIVVPLIFPTITTFLVVGIAGIFTNQANVYTFYADKGPTDVTTFGYFLFGQVVASGSTMSQYPYASAAGILFTFIAVPVTMLAKYLLERFGPSSEY